MTGNIILVLQNMSFIWSAGTTCVIRRHSELETASRSSLHWKCDAH